MKETYRVYYQAPVECYVTGLSSNNKDILLRAGVTWR